MSTYNVGGASYRYDIKQISLSAPVDVCSGSLWHYFQGTAREFSILPRTIFISPVNEAEIKIAVGFAGHAVCAASFTLGMSSKGYDRSYRNVCLFTGAEEKELFNIQ